MALSQPAAEWLSRSRASRQRALPPEQLRGCRKRQADVPPHCTPPPPPCSLSVWQAHPPRAGSHRCRPDRNLSEGCGWIQAYAEGSCNFSHSSASLLDPWEPVIVTLGFPWSIVASPELGCDSRSSACPGCKFLYFLLPGKCLPSCQLTAARPARCGFYAKAEGEPGSFSLALQEQWEWVRASEGPARLGTKSDVQREVGRGLVPPHLIAECLGGHPSHRATGSMSLAVQMLTPDAAGAAWSCWVPCHLYGEAKLTGTPGCVLAQPWLWWTSYAVVMVYKPADGRFSILKINFQIN